MTFSVHHIAINAHQPERLSAHYQAAAGFRQLASQGDIMWMAAPNAFIALYASTDAPGLTQQNKRVCDPGIGHFCVQSGDGKATWDRFAAADMAFNDTPVALGTGAIYAYGRDPEYNLVEVEGIADEPAATPPWIAHVALVSANLDRLAAFYETLIGRAVHNKGTFANALFENITGLKNVCVDAQWIMADNMIFEMWCYRNPATQGAPPPAVGAPGYRHVGFCCADLAAEILRLEAKGIVLEHSDDLFGIQAFSGQDPDGNRFILFEAPHGAHPLSLSGLSNPAFVTNRNVHLLGI